MNNIEEAVANVKHAQTKVDERIEALEAMDIRSVASNEDRTMVMEMKNSFLQALLELENLIDEIYEFPEYDDEVKCLAHEAGVSWTRYVQL